MPGIELGVEGLVEGLSSQDAATLLACVRRIKHLIIGNRTKKSSFMQLGVVPRLVSILEDVGTTEELLSETIITLGSFAHGTEENLQAVVAAGTLPLLAKGLLHPSPALVLCCLRTLRTLYSSSHTPLTPDPIFTDLAISRKLVALLSEPHPQAHCAAIILAKACQSCDHQNLLCAHGIIDPLTANLLSPVVKLVQASLQCLASIICANTPSAHLLASASHKGHSFILTVQRILSSSQGSETKLAAAKCLTYLYECGVIEGSSSTITHKVLPSLVRLTRKDMHKITVRTEAITALASLTQRELSLQELAADSDHLIPSLVQCLATPPDPSSDLVLDSDLVAFERLCAAIFLLLGSLAAGKEEIRYKVISERNMMKSLAAALASDHAHMRDAATRCLLSLSRSTKLLRTCIYDHECWKPVLDMMRVPSDQSLQVTTALTANLLLPFSPSRENLVTEGVLELLVAGLDHHDPVVMANCLWALMSVAEGCSQEVKQRLITALTYDKLISLLSPSSPLPLLIKAMGLLVNLTQDGSAAWGDVLERVGLLHPLEEMLRTHGSNGAGGVVEQCLCVLVNLSTCSEQVRNILAHSNTIIAAVSSILRSSDNVAVLMAGVNFVKNLVATDHDGHVHRQNCLKEFGLQFTLQKLEKKEHKRLHIQVIEAMESFSA